MAEEPHQESELEPDHNPTPVEDPEQQLESELASEVDAASKETMETRTVLLTKKKGKIEWHLQNTILEL